MNLMPAMELMAGGVRRWRKASFAAHLTTLGLALGCCLSGEAQEPNASAQTNDTAAAEVLSQLSDMVQPDDSVQPEDTAPANGLPQTNGVPQANVTAATGDR